MTASSFSLVPNLPEAFPIPRCSGMRRATLAREARTRAFGPFATAPEDGGREGHDVRAEEGTHDREASADDAHAGFDRGPDHHVHVVPWDEQTDISIDELTEKGSGRETHRSDPLLCQRSPDSKTA